MCGISVSLGEKNKDVALSVVKMMNDKVIHRGPDAEGLFYDNGVGFGHRRLSIIDLSSEGNQPMFYKDLIITYNGEVYNYQELKEELVGLGHHFKNATDTEVILAAYDQWGIEAFNRFNGMWSFAIYDKKENKVVLCRDRFGIKPLYYTEIQNCFYAASEIKQFTAHKAFEVKLQLDVFLSYFNDNILNHTEKTFFQGVKELKGGHYIEYNLDYKTFEIKKWYNFNIASSTVDEYDLAKAKFKSIFYDGVRKRMRSDVEVGSCLSGGLDSTSIVGAVYEEKLYNQEFKTITSCYKDQSYDESYFSDLASKKYGFKNIKTYPNLDELIKDDLLTKIVYYQDQPILGASHFSEYSVFKKAKEEGITVMLDGQGSDEYLCGYGHFTRYAQVELLKQGKLISLFKSLIQRSKTYKTNFRIELFKLINFLRVTKKTELTKEYLNLPLLYKYYKPINNDYKNVSELTKAELFEMSIPYQLHSEDRNSMLFSIESRLPFLDYRLVEYVASLPTVYKIDRGWTKKILRDSMEILPNDVRYRKDKMGFVAPDKELIVNNIELIRNELKDLIKISNGLFNQKIIQYLDDKNRLDAIKIRDIFKALCMYRFLKIFEMQIEI